MLDPVNNSSGAFGPFVRVKNKVFDSWCGWHMAGNVWKVYFVIYRLSVGYQKDWVQITRAEFKKRTGLHDDVISRALQYLEQSKKICRNRHTGIPNYKVNQHFTTWEIPEKDLKAKDLPKSSYRSRQNRHTDTVSTKDNNKEKKKEEERKESFFSYLEQSKDETEKLFFEAFRVYPLLSGWEKALEEFKAAVKVNGGYLKICRALLNYQQTRAYKAKAVFRLDNFMKNWPDFYDTKDPDELARLEAERIQKEKDKAAEKYRKECDAVPEEERKKISELVKKTAAEIGKKSSYKGK